MVGTGQVESGPLRAVHVSRHKWPGVLPQVGAVAGSGGTLEAHSLGTLEARLVKSLTNWPGRVVLMSPPPFGGGGEGVEGGVETHCA